MRHLQSKVNEEIKEQQSEARVKLVDGINIKHYGKVTFSIFSGMNLCRFYNGYLCLQKMTLMQQWKLLMRFVMHRKRFFINSGDEVSNSNPIGALYLHYYLKTGFFIILVSS